MSSLDVVDLASDHLHLRHSEACFLGYLTGRARAHTNFWWFSGLNLGLQYSSAAASGHLHHGDPGRRRQSLPTNQCIVHFALVVCIRACCILAQPKSKQNRACGLPSLCGRSDPRGTSRLLGFNIFGQQGLAYSLP